MKKTILATALLVGAVNTHAQGINLAPLVPADLVTSLTGLAVGDLLPIAGELINSAPLSDQLLGGLALGAPLTDLVLGGDSLKGLSNFYGPLDSVLAPVVALTSQDGLGAVLAAPLDILVAPVNPVLATLGGGAQPLNGLTVLFDPLSLILDGGLAL